LQGFGEDGAKRVGAKGFRDDGQPPLVGTLRHGGLTQPRDEDDWQERDAAPDGFHDYPSADRGHNDIDEDKIPAPLIEASQPTHGVGGCLTIVPERRKQVRQHLSHVLIVVDQEHPETAGIRHSRRNSRGSCPLLSNRIVQGASWPVAKVLTRVVRSQHDRRNLCPNVSWMDPLTGWTGRPTPARRPSSGGMTMGSLDRPKRNDWRARSANNQRSAVRWMKF
jgi:hypothetical protein